MCRSWRFLIVLLAITTVAQAQISIIDNASEIAHDQFNERYGLASLSLSEDEGHRYSIIMEASSCTKDVNFFIDFPDKGKESKSYLRATRSLSDKESALAYNSLVLLDASAKAQLEGSDSLSKRFMRQVKKVCAVDSAEDVSQLRDKLKPLFDELRSLMQASAVTAPVGDHATDY